jgi:AAA ATPase domain
MKLNPFFPNDPIPPSLFVGRVKEVGTISRALFQTLNGRPESVLVVGARGSGKTSLVQYASSFEESSALHGDALGGKVVSVLVRCGGMRSLGEFAAACLNEIKQHLEMHAQVWATAKKIFEELEIDAVYIKLKTKDPTANPTTDFPRVLKKLWSDKLSKRYGALQLLIDETDDLSTVPEFPGFIKNIIETIKERPVANIQLVVTVVDERLRNIIHNHPSFPRVFHVATLGPLTEAELEAVVQRCLQETKPLVAVDKGALRMLKLFTAGIPNYLHQFCHEAFEVDQDNVIAIDDVVRGANGTKEVRGSFDILWEKHFKQKYAEDMQSAYKRKILHTLSLIDEPASNGTISALYKEIFKEAPSSNITVFLTNMVNDGAIKRFGKGSPYLYQLADPLMKVLLRFYPGTNQKIYDRISNYMLEELVSAVESKR